MAVSYKDYYKVLEVPRDAGTEEISKAYKKLARKHHPDLNQGDPTAEERFKDINEAYEVLKDPEKRRLYDQLGPNWKDGQQFQGAPGFENMHFNFNGQNFSGGDFSDFFEALFGQHGGQGAAFGGASPFGGFSGRSRRGRDIEAELDLTLEDVMRGGEKSVALNTHEGPKTLNIKIPAGIRSNGKMRLAGQGGAGSPAGDLYLTVRYKPHPLFQVEGDTITTEVAVFPWEAALGTTVRVPTLEGAVEMKIPAGSSSGRKMRLRGKGLGAPGRRGDEIAVVAIKTPASLTAREKELWQALADAAGGKV